MLIDTVLSQLNCVNQKRRLKLLLHQALATAWISAAEGTGLEPATPYGAPDFESGC